MTKYIIGEIFSSGEATLYKNPSDQTVLYIYLVQIVQSSSGGCVVLPVSSLDFECKSLKSIWLQGKGTIPGSEKTALECAVNNIMTIVLKTVI